MDPNETLDRIRDGVSKYDSLDQSDTSMALIVAEEVVENFQALDEWLSRGGFPPDAWRVRESIGRGEADLVLGTLAELVEAVGRGDEHGLPEAYRAALATLRDARED